MKYTNDAKALINYDEETLYVKFGKEFSSNSFIPLPDNHYAKIARDWLNDHLGDLQKMICNNESVKKHAKEETVLLIALIADIVASKWNFSNPATCAALIVRIGITKICS